MPEVAAWLTLAMARWWAADEGEPEHVADLLSGLPEDLRRRARYLLADALLNQGDSTGGVIALSTEAGRDSGWQAALAWSRVGAIHRLRGDSARAVTAYREALVTPAGGEPRIGAAGALLRMGERDRPLLHAMADVLARGGRSREALPRRCRAG